MQTRGTIFITGGTSGIGLGLAQRLAAAGNTVIISGRRTELLDSITAGHDDIEAVALDISDPDSIQAAFTEVTTRFPDTNVVINMAGIMRPEDLRTGADLPTAEATISTNLLGPIRMLSSFVPFLLGRENATIINVTSGLAFVPLPATPTYSATKAALHSYTQSLRVQLAGTSVQVLEFAPPLVATDLKGQADNPMAMPLEDYLDEVMALLETQPDADEVLVERVKRQRFAEATGGFDEVLAAQSAPR